MICRDRLTAANRGAGQGQPHRWPSVKSVPEAAERSLTRVQIARADEATRKRAAPDCTPVRRTW